MGKTSRNKKFNMDFLDNLCSPPSTALTTTDATNRLIGARILPAAQKQDQLFLVHLMAIVNSAVSQTRCIAKTCGGKRCGCDISWKDALAAMQATNFLGSDHFILLADLNLIATQSTCKRYFGGKPHSRQSAEIVKGWMDDARAMSQESLMGAAEAMLSSREAKSSQRGLPMGGARRVDLVDSEDEGV